MLYSAGVIVYDYSENNPHILCVRSYKKWDFPKGKLNKGESTIEAAYRELCEETSLAKGLDVEHVEDWQTEKIVYGKGQNQKTAVYFLAKRVSTKTPYLPVSPELGRPENDQFLWVPVTKLNKIMPNRLLPVVKQIQKYFEKESK